MFALCGAGQSVVNSISFTPLPAVIVPVYRPRNSRS